MTVNIEELTMSELKLYIGHLERVLKHYNRAEVTTITTEDFKEVVKGKEA